MANSSASAAHRRRATGPAPSLTGPASDVHPVLRRATAPPAALDLLAQARAGLDEAAVLETPNERYATAHLAALRTAAAVLADGQGRFEVGDTGHVRQAADPAYGRHLFRQPPLADLGRSLGGFHPAREGQQQTCTA